MNVQEALLFNRSFVFTTILLLSSLSYGHDYVSSIRNTLSAPNGEGDRVTLSNLVSNLTRNKARGFSSTVKTNMFGEIIGVALYGHDVSQTNIILIASIPTLESLCLGCCTNETNIVDEQAFAALKRAERFTTLEIYGGVPLVTTKMCETILALPMLRNLKIEFCRIEKDGKQCLLQTKRPLTLTLPDESP